MLSQHFRMLTIGAAVLALCACASTPFISTWTARDVQSLNPAGKTIAVVYMSRDESLRSASEDVLAGDLTKDGAHGVAAHTLLSSEKRGDGEAARARLKQAAVNGVVVMRVVAEDQRIKDGRDYAVLGSYNGFGPYWDYGWGAVSEPVICSPTRRCRSRRWCIRSTLGASLCGRAPAALSTQAISIA
jgi:hypothetical protein